MAGYKITTIFAILFVLGACVGNSYAKDGGRKAKVPAEKDAVVDKKIEQCVAQNCKPPKGKETPDLECVLGCLKYTIYVKDKVSMKQLDKDMTSSAQAIFCFIGCATSGVCPEDNKSEQETEKKCIFGCAALCMPELVLQP